MKELLHHLFLPHVSNNYRPKILHHKSILVVAALLFFAGFSFSAVRTSFPSVLGTYSNISSEQLLLFTNQKRQENGLSALSLNQQLSEAASSKANDMFAQDYWAHISPDGKTPWVFIKAAGYNYIYAGENLARGFTSASDVVDAWMASPEHRKNMLSTNYQNVGYAAETGKLNGEDTVLVVEMLGSTALAVAPAPAPVTNQLANNTEQETVSAPSSPIPTPTPSPVPIPTSELTNKTQETVPAGTLASKTGKSVLEANKIANFKPLINSATISSDVSRGVAILFIFALILDMIIIERRKVIRLVGHNMDHILFLTLILLLITLIVKGAIV
jgi:hypothetical protein